MAAELEQVSHNVVGAVAEETGNEDVDAGTSDPDKGESTAKSASDAAKVEQKGDSSLDATTFQQKWGLDERSMAMLQGLPCEKQTKVMAGFSPDADTVNLNAKFVAWVRREARQPKSASAGTQAKAPGMKSLAALPASAVGAHIVGLQPVGAMPPPPRLWAPPGLGPADSPKSHIGSDVVDGFLKQWGLSEQSGKLLRSLPEPIQQNVLAGFTPGTSTRNLDRKLNAYVRSKLSGQSLQGRGPNLQDMNQPVPWNVIKHFADRWSLDGESLQALSQLPPDVCAEVVTHFSPPTGTRSVNAVLQAFIRKRLWAFRKNANLNRPQFSVGLGVQSLIAELGNRLATSHLPLDTHLGAGRLPANSNTTRPGAPRRGRSLRGAIGSAPSAVGPRRRRGLKGVPKSQAPTTPSAAEECHDEHVVEFAARWSLDSDAQRALRNLPEDLQSRVFSEFAPHAETKDISGRLQSFIRFKILPTEKSFQRPRRSDRRLSSAVGSGNPPARTPPPGLADSATRETGGGGTHADCSRTEAESEVGTE
mmetsp:Transcript_36584/g.101542  ORF Transcript_36584/g.101542 Transcript_36584/m.101542 type:complete len:534 (-) Transcript_36584:71-1672(-)